MGTMFFYGQQVIESIGYIKTLFGAALNLVPTEGTVVNYPA